MAEQLDAQRPTPIAERRMRRAPQAARNIAAATAKPERAPKPPRAAKKPPDFAKMSDEDYLGVKDGKLDPATHLIALRYDRASGQCYVRYYGDLHVRETTAALKTVASIAIDQLIVHDIELDTRYGAMMQAGTQPLQPALAAGPPEKKPSRRPAPVASPRRRAAR